MAVTNDNATTMGLRISKEELKKIEEFWRKNLYDSRSDMIMKAIKNLMEGRVCAQCGAVNPKGSHFCAVCFRPLDEYDPTMSILTVLANNKAILDEFEKNNWD